MLMHLQHDLLFVMSDFRLTRSNDNKLKTSHCCSTRDANFFSNCVVNIWIIGFITISHSSASKCNNI